MNPTPDTSSLKTVCFLALIMTALFPLVAAAQNPIVLENQLPGTSAWQSLGNTGSDSVGQMKGYMSATSINKGETIDFHVSVNTAQTFTIDLYRLGWYQGLGGRLIQHIGPLNGTKQPTCPIDTTTGLIECQWAVAYTLQTQTSWTSGVYIAVLTNSLGFQNWTHFVVRDDNRAAQFIYQLPVTTYQAYNDYPYDNSTGKSLYAFNSYGSTTVGRTKAAVKVSFDRPYNSDGDCGVWGFCLLAQDTAFIRWLEKSGYDVAYNTDVDNHANPGRLLDYRAFLTAGHDEYWSKAMYDGVLAARDAGVNLGFFSANTIYWQIRFEPSSSGVPNRTIVCYRDATIDPNPDPQQKTVNWRDPVVNRPEQTLVGVQYTDIVDSNSNGTYATYIVNNSNNWVYAGTGFKDGDTVAGIVGYEADRLLSEFPGPTSVPGTYTLLSHSPFKASGAADYSNSSVYQANSGAWVFGSGTINWANGLDSFSLSGGNFVDARIQQTTTNILNRFISGTPQGDFSISGSPASRTVTPGAATNYSVTINPANGFSGLVTLGVSGLPTGATASFSPNPATATSTLSVNTTAATPVGTYTLTITGTSGALSHTSTVTLIVSSSPDYSLSGSPSSQSVSQGNSTSYGVTVTPTSGFAGQVTLSVTGLPTGASGSFSPNPATSSSSLSVSTSPTTPVGAYTLTITGVSGSLTHNTTVTLVVTAPDFSLSATPSSQTIVQGGSTSYGLTVTPTNGFADQVTLSINGLPVGATAGFSPDPATSTSTLSVVTTLSTPAGSYPLTVTGVSGTLTHTATLTLVVTVPDFSLSATPASQTVTQGGSANYTATITDLFGFASPVTLSVTGLPTGATGSFSPNPASSTSTLSVATIATTPAGSYTLTITGTSGALTHSTTVTLVVAAPGVKYDNKVSSGIDFGVTKITTPSFTIGTGADRAAMIMVSMSANTATNITASLGGVAGTLIPGTDSAKTATIRTMIFQVINPPSGAQTATVSWTTSMNADVGVITVSGADQTTPTSGGIFSAFTSNPNKTASVTIPSTAGDLTASIGYSKDIWVTPFTNQSLKWGVDSTVVGGDIGPGTGTTTHTWTDQYQGQANAVSGANFKAVPTAPDFTLSGSPSSQSVIQGASADYGITVTPKNSFSGSVTLSVTGLPTGATGTFTPNPATSTSTLSVTTGANTPTGSYPLTITGVSGILTQTATITLVVTAPPDFTLAATPASQTVVQGASTNYATTIAPLNGFAGQVTLSVTGLPTGAAGTFTPNPATSSSTLAVTTASDTPTGSYTLTITGDSGTLTHTSTVTLVVNAPPDFTLDASPSSQAVVQGASANYATTLSPLNGFAGQVTLSVTGLPTGATGTFTPNPATSSSTLAVTTAANTPTGSYTLTITGTSGTLSHTSTVTLVVNAPPDYTLGASPSSQAVIQGSSADYGVTVTAANGFAGQVTLSVTGLPTGATGTFTPNPATSSSTLAVTTAANTPTGSYTLTITGTSGALTQTTTVTLTVNGPPDFSVSGSPSSQSVIQGASTSYGVSLTPAYGFAGQVTFSVTGLPTGASGLFTPNPATTSSNLSITTAADTPTGSYTLTITGVSGSLTHTASVTLVVNAPPDFSIAGTPSSRTITQGGSTSYAMAITPVNSFAGQVTFSVTGLPTGATGVFTPNPATSSSTLSITTSSNTPTGTYTLTIDGVSGSLTHSTTVELVVNAAPDFSVAATPPSQTVVQGGSTSYDTTVTPANGFAGQVTFSVTGMPTGATGTFSPNPATSSATLALTTGANTPTGTYTLTITGVSGSLTHTTTIVLVVNPAPDFSVAGTPSSQTILQGGSTSYGVNVTPANGFAGQVTLSVTGLPTGATASFTPNPTGSTSTLAVNTIATTPTGTFTLTVTGVSGSLTHSTTVTLVVSGVPDYTITATPASQTLIHGASTTYSATVVPIFGFAGQVTFSVTGLPTGATAGFTPNPSTSSSTLSVVTLATTPVGSYPLTITGVNGSLTHTAVVTLVVTAAQVAFDNSTKSGIKNNVASVTTPAFTIGAGANRAAMIMVVMNANTATNITASLGGVAGTLIPGTDSGTTASIRTMIFQVVNPPSGSRTATVSWTTKMSADVGVITVTGADQTTPTSDGTFVAFNSDPSKAASVTILSSPGDLTASVGYTKDTWVSPFTNQIKKWGIDSKVAGGDVGRGTGTTTHTWTDRYTGQVHSVSGANFNAASGQ